MSRKLKQSLKKNQREVQNYRNSLKNPLLLPEETSPINNEFLMGTAETVFDKREETESDKKIIKKPMRYVIYDWIKAHILDGIILAIITGIFTVVLNGAINIALLKQKIEDISNQIEGIQESNVQKEVLDLELENIKSDINNSFLISFNDIKWKIEVLEEKIREISK